MSEEGGVGEVAYLGLGSNLGDRIANLRTALAALADRCSLEAVSTVYETEPVGFREQGPFLNIAARARGPEEPAEWLAVCRDVEAGMGRERTFRNAPRTIDIDVLLVGDRRIDQPGLAVPHPRMSERAFVLVPLVELAPALREPGTGRRYADVLAGLDRSGVKAYAPGEELWSP